MLRTVQLILVSASLGLALEGLRALPAIDATATADEELLHNAGIATGTEELLAYLRRQIVTEASRQQIEQLIGQLGSKSAAVRAEAAQKLIAFGEPALPWLREAVRSRDADLRQQAEACLIELDKRAGSVPLAAVIRLLVHRRVPDALPLLLAYGPDALDENVEEEVLTGLGLLGVRQGKLDPLLTAALQDPLPARRALVACALGRTGEATLRGTVRQLLADPDPKVRRYAAHGLLGTRWPRSPDDSGMAEDEAMVQQAKLGTDTAALVQFFRRRTLHEADVQEIQKLIKDLGSDRFRDREEATQRLLEFGAAALPMLRTAARGADLEVTRRAEICVEAITTRPGPSLPIAALRLLARRPSDDAVAVLLAYVPFADDSSVEEEVLTTLSILGTREPRPDPALSAALRDTHAARRAAAALVLGRVGDQDQCAALRPLLKDASGQVRLRAAQGLLAVRERAAVETLLALLVEGDLDVAQRAELLLQQLAGEQAPTVSLGTAPTAAGRQSCQEAWLTWWRTQGSHQELPNLEQGVRHLGLTLAALLVGNNANGNQVCEFGPDGKLRWELTNLQGPIDAHLLGNDRLLIAEHNAQLVTERDLRGKVLWQYKVNGNPVACQRLSNGNTFIATYNSVLEVTRPGQLVYQHHPNAGIGGVIYDACRLPNGNIVCISGRGTVLELNPSGKVVTTIPVSNNGGWGGVTALPNGRFLVALMNPGKVVEVDRNNKVYWECPVPQACHAVRLPNGHTLVACMNIQKIVEVNRAGQTVREIPTNGRPFHVRRR